MTLCNRSVRTLSAYATVGIAVVCLYYQVQIMFVLRSSVWFLKGLREYTKSGYERAAKNFAIEDLHVDCSGRSYLISGSNSGIGKSVALEVAKRGGTVHMLCRNRTSAEEVCTEIKTVTGNQNVHIHIVDMARPRDIVAFTQRFAYPLDVLVNNAGCMVNTREVDEEGLEKNFATNVLGTYLLTVGLLTKINSSSDARIITVSSGGMLTQKLNADDLQSVNLQPFDGTTAYAQNKRAQIIMSEQLSKLSPQIHFSTMHPGWADTPAVRSSMPDFYEKMKNKLRSAEQGADTAVWLAVAPAARKFPTGLFFQDRAPVSTHLPLACTQSSAADEASLMKQLDDFCLKYSKSTNVN